MPETTNTIGFKNRAQVTLFHCELQGQISDGAWENSEPHNHWQCMTRAKAFVAESPAQLGTNFTPVRYYNFARADLITIDFIEARMLGAVKYYSLFHHLDPEYRNYYVVESLHSVGNLEWLFGKAIDRDQYHLDKLQKLMDLHNITEPARLVDIARQVQAVDYDVVAMKKDLAQMKKIMHCRQNGTPEQSAQIFGRNTQMPTTARAPRATRIPYLRRLEEMVEAGMSTPKEIVANIMAEFPESNIGGVKTVVSDLRNEKYSKLKHLIVVVGADGIMRVSEQTGANIR